MDEGPRAPRPQLPVTIAKTVSQTIQEALQLSTLCRLRIAPRREHPVQSFLLEAGLRGSQKAGVVSSTR